MVTTQVKSLFYFLGFFLFSFTFSAKNLLADNVELKNAKVYENVKAGISPTTVRFIFEEKQLAFKKVEVKRIRLKPVISKPPVTDIEKAEYDAERIRVAEALQNTSDKEIAGVDKPAIVILQFSAGDGVQLNEVETVTNLIRTSLVKTKLFEIVDTSSLLKDCPKQTKDCVNQLPQDVRRNKIITGTITKLGKTYYINGNVLDAKKNSIDFAETSSASNVDKLDAASENFAKKVAGGIMEYLEEPTKGKEELASANEEKKNFRNVQYLWRSALLPGWGQIKYATENDKKYAKYKGIGFASLISLLSIYTYSSYTDLKKQENSSNSFHNFYLLYPKGSLLEQGLLIEDEKRNQALQDSTREIMAGIYAIGFIYFLNVVDSFFPEKYFVGFGTPSSKTQALSIQFLPEKNSQNLNQGFSNNPYFLFSYQWRF